jgi:hypothetical protein
VDFAASVYFCTLNVENCGASGMPMTLDTPVAASSLIASAMNGFQFRMPTATGTGRPLRASSVFSAFPCSMVMSVSGERPPMASQFCVISFTSSADGSRPPRTKRR